MIRRYHFEKKPTFSDKFGACLSYLEELIETGYSLWESLIQGPYKMSFTEFSEWDGELFFIIAERYRVTYHIRKMETAQPVPAFLTSKYPKIREQAKRASKKIY